MKFYVAFYLSTETRNKTIKKISNPLKLNDVQIDKVDCGKGRRETAHRLHHSDRFPKNVGKSLRNEKESRRLVRIFDSIFQFKTMIAMVIEIEKKSSNWKTFGIYFIVNKMYFFRPICCHWRIRPFETLIKIEHPFSKISPRFSLSMASILGETYWNGSNHSAALIQINAFEMRIYVYYRHHFSRHPYLSDEIIVIKSRYDLIDSIAVQSQITGWPFFSLPTSASHTLSADLAKS